MNCKNIAKALLLWTAAVTPALSQTASTGDSAAVRANGMSGEGTSFVLVRASNGSERVQKGQVIEDGARYEVRLAERSSLWVPKQQVLFIGETIEEVYDYRANRVIHWGAGDHFQMSRWCIQHGLISQAIEHYTIVSDLHPKHPSVRQLGIELKEGMLDDEGFRRFLGIAEPPKPTRLAQRTPKEVDSEAVQPASATADSVASSPAVLREFTRTIQPILKNRCSQAACHGYRTKTDLQLIHPYGEKASQITERNLEQIRKYLQTDGTSDPPLIRYAVTAHGPARSPAISERELPLIQELFGFAALLQNRVVPAVAHQTGSTGAGVQTSASAPGRQMHSTPAAVRPQPVPGGAQQLIPQSRPPAQGDATQAARPGTAPASPSRLPEGEQSELMKEIDALELQIKKQLGEPVPASGAAPPAAAEFNAKRRKQSS